MTDLERGSVSEVSDFTAEKYAARDLLDGEWDPRSVSARALVREARLFDRVLQPGNELKLIEEGVEYSIK